LATPTLLSPDRWILAAHGGRILDVVEDAVFVDRATELAVLQRCWQAVLGGAGRVVGVHGEPGIGKSALVTRFRATVGPDSFVQARGHEEDRLVPWSLLTRVVRELAAVGHLPAAFTPDPQADPLLLGEGLAGVFAEFERRVIVVEDAHLADLPSLHALAVAAREVADTSVMLVVALQRWPETLDPVPGQLSDLEGRWERVFELDHAVKVHLTGLSSADLIHLAVGLGYGGLTPEGAGRLREHTGGNPLFAKLVLQEVPLHAVAFGAGPLPVPKGQAIAVARLADCPAPTRAVIDAGAVLGQRFSLEEVRTLADVADARHAAGQAVDLGILAETPGSAGTEYLFTDSITRAAVYHEIDRNRRRRLHGAAARIAGPRALRHRVEAAEGYDERLAEDLERAARARMTSDNVVEAAWYMRQALAVTPPSPARTPRLLTAVEIMLIAGDNEATGHYEGELGDLEPTAWSSYVIGYRLLLGGDVEGARAHLTRALERSTHGGPEHPTVPPDLQARIATQLAIIAIIAISDADMVRYGSLAVKTAKEPRVMAFASFALAIGLALAGRSTDALSSLSRADRPGEVHGLDCLAARGMIRLWTDDLPGAHRDLSTVVNRAINGEPLRIAQAVAFLGEVDYRMGVLDESVLHTQLALGNAEAYGRIWDFPMLHGLATYPLAAQGSWTRAEHHAAQAASWARVVGSRVGLAYAIGARAAIAQAKGDAEWLLDTAEELAAVFDPHEPGTHLYGPLRADALARLARTAEATVEVDRFAHTVQSVGRRSTEMAIARVRGQIAAAEGRHRRAIGHYRLAWQFATDIGMPFEAARVEQLAGVSRAELRDRVTAERALRTALRAFESMSAAPYVAATLEIAERYQLPIAENPPPRKALTKREQEIIHLFCDGMSNRQIAAQLAVCLKTVEFHKRNAYTKLGVRGRRALRELLRKP
jgi:DNA-binding CsgD family transcriptional regulator